MEASEDKHQHSLASESSLNFLEKRQQFAVTLRKKKTQEAIAKKRKKIKAQILGAVKGTAETGAYK